MRILVAEDEKDMNRLISRALEKEGYGVDSCYDGEEAMEYLESADYDGAVLDIMMPKKDGYQIVKELRQKGDDTPVIFLTARDSIADRVKGLDLGADDYLIKPFDFDELLARIRVMTRRKTGQKTSTMIIGDLIIDTASQQVSRGGRNIELSAREYAILKYMALNKGRVLSREQIEDHVWNFDYEGGSNVVDVYISYLRKKIDGSSEEKLIHTAWGRGWVLREADKKPEPDPGSEGR
ncbi:MAG TPA: response regulator transcription factor [Candidatus Avilachnospira avicola]|nr:response regulator transcription factor [Candidatus Avilachnospira avicola]